MLNPRSAADDCIVRELGPRDHGPLEAPSNIGCGRHGVAGRTRARTAFVLATVRRVTLGRLAQIAKMFGHPAGTQACLTMAACADHP